jgi:hypothetical protein
MNTGKKTVLMTLLAEVLNVLFLRGDVLIADLWRVVQPQDPLIGRDESCAITLLRVPFRFHRVAEKDALSTLCPALNGDCHANLA